MEKNCDRQTKSKSPTANDPGTIYPVFKNGTKDEIIEILQHKIDLNCTNENGDTMLHAILENDSLVEKDVVEILTIILIQGVDPNVENHHEKTALHLAVERRMKNAVDCLLKFKTNLYAVNERGDSIAHFFVEDEYKKCKWSVDYPIMNTVKNREAMENHSVSFLKFLTEKFINFNIENEQGQSALHLAFKYYLPHILPTLLFHTYDIMSINKNNKTLLEQFLEECASTSIHSTSRSHLPDENQYPGYHSRYATKIFRILLERVVFSKYDSTLISNDKRKITVMQALTNYYLNNCKDKNFVTTTGTKNSHTLEVLKDTGIDFNVRLEHGQNLLHWLAEEGNHEGACSEFCKKICNFLISCGCDVNTKDHRGKSALHLATTHGNVLMMQTLIKLGAEINCKDKSMRTPLHEAVMTKESEKILKLLFKHGADVNAKDSEGNRPIHLVFANANAPMAKMLLPRGLEADVVTTHCRGRKLSHRTFSESKSPPALKALLKKGAYVNVRNNQGESALYHAINLVNRFPILELLKHGANLNDPNICKLIVAKRRIMISHIYLHHWIQLDVANLPINEHYKSFIPKNCDLQYRGECLKEVEKLKSTFIDDRKSLYDFLQMHLTRRGAYVNNMQLQQLVKSPTLNEQFPNYSLILLASYHEAVARKSLLEAAKTALYELIEGELADSIDHIIGYLDDGDMVNIIETNVYRDENNSE